MRDNENIPGEGGSEELSSVSTEEVQFPALQVSHLTKEVNGVEILGGIDFEISGVGCFGILGENGSGKTTLLRAIAGLIFPTKGEVHIKGISPHAAPEIALKQLGGFVGIPAFYPHLSAYDNLRIMVDLKKEPTRDEVASVLDEVGLADEIDKKVGAYSRGMLQRLGLALVFLKNPSISILDEPTQGLDSVWIDRLISILRNKSANGGVYIIVSHDFDFIMKLCKDVLVLADNRQIYFGPIKEVAEFSYYYLLRAEPAAKVRRIIADIEFVHRSIEEPHGTELVMEEKYASELIKKLVDGGCSISECSLKHYSVPDLVNQRKAGNGKQSSK